MVIGFPNPVEDLYHLQNVAEGVAVKVVDLTDRAVLRTQVRNSAVNVRALRSGSYLLLIQDKQGLKVHKR